MANDLGIERWGLDLAAGHRSTFGKVTAQREITYGGASEAHAFRHETDVHAGYATVHRSARGAAMEAGLRIEGERARTAGGAVTTNRAVRLFPTIRMRWTDWRRQLAYRASYARRIDRPESSLLNPYAMGDHDLNDIVGNPDLRPELTDEVEVGIEREGSRVSLQLTPFHRRSRDPIRPLKQVTGSGHAVTTVVNLARARTTGAEGSAQVRLRNGSVVTLSGSVAHLHASADTIESGGLRATARVAADLRVASRITVHVYLYRRSAQAIEQGEIMPAFTSQFALTQRVAGDRGRVTLRLDDPFRSDRLEYRIASATFTQRSSRRIAQPLVSLFMSWAMRGQPAEDTPRRAEEPVVLF